MDLRTKSPFDCLLFDLDDTLYSSKIGIAGICKKNIEEFLVQKCGFAAEKALLLRVELFKTYGSSLAGLRALGYDINADDYHSFVHGSLPYERLKQDLRLRNVLQSITQRKIIFTNSDRNHARKVIERLGIEDCFDEIICFETLNPNISKSRRPEEFPVLLKPSMEAVKIALDIARADPRRTVRIWEIFNFLTVFVMLVKTDGMDLCSVWQLFFDDSDRNITAGRALGLRTALVGKPVKSEDSDYLVESIVNLKKIIPEIWAEEEEEEEEEEGIARTRSEMESMIQTTPVGA